MDKDPREVMNQARLAFENKEYASSLDNYQWFYSNSIQINRAFYGVRLSYCLDEWAELGQEYLPAKEALIKLKENTLVKFRNTLSYQSFHEYSSIAKYLSDQEEVFQEFLLIHVSNKDLAVRLFTFVYEYCATNCMWGYCREYIGDGESQYNDALETYDQLIKFSNTKSSESMSEEATEYVCREILWILNMLSHVKADDEYKMLMLKVESDLRGRGAESSYNKICSMVTLNNN